MTKLIVKNFTGKTTAVDADFDWTVAELKAAIAESKGNKNATRSNLVHGGHELRDHRRLSHYRIAEGDTLHITPPSKEPKIELKFEKDTDPGTIFTLAVDPSITVAQLKQEISIEEGADAVQLKYISTPDEPAPEVLVAGSSEEEEDDIVAPTLELLHDDAKLSSYPLQDEVITVYTRAHMITVSSMGAQVTIPVDPAKPIKLLRPVLSRHYAIPAPADLCFTWNGQDLLDEERSLLEYSVPSGAQVQLALPTEFSVTLALHDDDACKKVQVVATAHHTVEEFRNSVLIQHEMDLSDSVLIMMGRELAAEDKSLLELGVVPMCTIHAVEYLILRIKAESWTSNVLTLHPLTRLSALRPIIAQDMPAPDGSAPFTEYWFTVDGQSYLKESRTLWDLGIPSGSTLYLRPSGSKFTFTVKVRSAPDNGPRTYVIEAHDNELVSDFKSRVCDITGLSAKSRLSVRNKHMEDHRTLKDFDLVGGETLEITLRESKRRKPGRIHVTREPPIELESFVARGWV
ncbi:hypothetical protein PLICRDRAFT_324028 [Plicaturopsis crispa FD-325 SS-3]|nr:hypothetical protein PLICRDRAFT_324028 [Plicaturopsis crispa FD-325 SS-3]